MVSLCVLVGLGLWVYGLEGLGFRVVDENSCFPKLAIVDNHPPLHLSLIDPQDLSNFPKLPLDHPPSLIFVKPVCLQASHVPRLQLKWKMPGCYL